MTGTSTNENRGILQRVDPLILLGAIIALFLALASEPWWTLTGTTTSKLLSVQVSPYYLQITATGIAPSASFTTILGSITRFLLILGFIALAASSIRPTAWWRNLAVYFGLSTLAELYFSFLIMYHAAETTLLTAYGIVLPYSGTSHLPANILGLDLNYYSNPLVTASFALPFYLGFLSLGLVAGRLILKNLQDRVLLLASSFLGRGVSEIYLTPPYQHVWLSTGDKELNPLGKDPERLTDDELLVSFEKLYETVEPGGSVAIILPAWATSVGERFQKLIPYTGFTIEKSGIIYRVQGIPETELLFRKPVDASPEAGGPTQEMMLTEPPALGSTLAEGAVESEEPPVLETTTEPAWVPANMTRLERAMLKSAVNIIARRQEPVPYRELLNEVYMELVDKKVDFDSARQIETTLLDHSGRELLVVEQTDESRDRVVKKWWIGEQKMTPEGPILPFLRRVTRRARPKVPDVHKLLRKWQRRPRYRPRRQNEED